MLDVAMKFLADQIDAYVLARTGSEFGEVELGRLVDGSGKWVIQDDRIGAAVINLEEDNTFKAQLPTATFLNGRQVFLEPELKINLLVLFAAHFRQYDMALQYLAHVLTFFQAHRAFTHEAFPGLDERIDKLHVELQTLSFEQLNQVWAFVGGRQIPSVIYKVRLVVLQDIEPSAIQIPVTRIQAEIQVR